MFIQNIGLSHNLNIMCGYTITIMKTLQPQTQTFWVLITDGKARLVFFTEESAKTYLKNCNMYANTTVQKVYSETKFVEIQN